MTKRFIALLLALLLLLSLSACASAPVDNTESPSHSPAVAQKMGRHWIGVEMDNHAYTHYKVRMDKVNAGETPVASSMRKIGRTAKTHLSLQASWLP